MADTMADSHDSTAAEHSPKKKNYKLLLMTIALKK